MNHVDQAYLSCRDLMMAHSKTFYKAFSLLPPRQKKAVWAVYAFCRYADDLVDEAGKYPETLDMFEEKLEGFLQGKAQEGFIWTALADVFSQFDMDPQPFRDMIIGQRMDVVGTSYSTLEAVEEYAYYVAGSVGLMLLPLIAPDTKHLLQEDAVKLGNAMQLTNILRDVGEDYERNRMYLPHSLLKEHHVDVHMLSLSHVPTEGFKQVWEIIAQRAETLYDEALSTITLYPMYSRTPIKGAAYMYRAILTKIRKNKYQVFTERHYVTVEEKQHILSQL
ncbi:phytoene/squalene synthase family protein [Aureibacillus halotolerans]|uniref:Phytoene synthase n=1 Tax=Aureibacillus halotolerans TaxID=1508390 RepID=A0A4R6U8F8_9BACI|nr:phytoene/squalene synthase family protein [Aureibacillus halotolerans]TDQ42086.1 phytoene synthase [Aureibacillus halotolerans]